MRFTEKKPEWRNKFCTHCGDTGRNPDYKARKALTKEQFTHVFTEPYEKKYHALTCPVCTA